MSRTTSRAATLAGFAVTTVTTGVFLAPSALAAELSTPTVSSSVVAPGDTITVWGEGCLQLGKDRVGTTTAYVGTDVRATWNAVEVAEDGTWQAELTFPVGTQPDTYTITAACDTYFDIADYPSVSVTVEAPTSTGTKPTGQVRGRQANTPGVASPDGASTTGDTTAPGRKVVKVLTGFQPFEVVTVTLHSTPQTVGTFTADASGTVTVSFTVPEGTPAGEHTLVYEGSMGTYFQESLTVSATTTGATQSATTDVETESASLAYTGADIALPLGLGAGALALGGGLVLVARRRSAEGSQA